MKENTLPIKWVLGGTVILLFIFFWMHPPSKNTLVPAASGVSSQNNTGQSSAPNQVASSTTAQPINPSRTDAEILKSIALQNENRDRINALLAGNAVITAQIRQQVNATKYETVTSQSLPGPNTTPPPADLLAKLKSNELMHH